MAFLYFRYVCETFTLIATRINASADSNALSRCHTGVFSLALLTTLLG